MIREVKLGEICNILNGYAFKSKEYVEDGIRIIRITNVQKGIIQDTDPKYYKIDKIETLKNYMLKENDLLISLTGNVGRVGQISKELLPAGLNQRVGCIRIKEEKDVSIDYLYQYFNSYNFERDCINNSKGIAQKNLSTEWLKNYKMKIPSLYEQKRIAIELRHIQRIKDLKQQQLKELEQLIKSQFVEMFGSVELNDKCFCEQEMSDIADITSSKRIYAHEYQKSGVPFYRSKEIIELGNKKKPSIELFISTKRYEEIKEKYGIPKTGDILITAVGTIGETWIVDTKKPFYYKDGNVLQIRLKKESSKVYFKYVLDILIDIFKRKNVSGSSYSALTIEKFKKMKIIMPPIILQNQFSEIVKQIDKQKFEIEKSLKETQELYESLMEKYFG